MRQIRSSLRESFPREFADPVWRVCIVVICADTPIMDWLTNAIKNLTNVWDNTTVAMINKAEELRNTLEEILKCFEIEPTIQFVYEYAHGLPGTLFRVSWKK